LRDKYDEYFPLYDRFKKYFAYMNTGHKGQQHDIFAYNGGLFAPDEILDNIKINDDILSRHTVSLSNYDFESDVSVNILGHIFEHSLGEIENMQAKIARTAEHVPPHLADSLNTKGKHVPHAISKRKKDGVFYTPKYITKYIVENTVGKLCQEKKIELDIQEAEYEKERKGRQKATLKKLTQKLDDYRKWLLQITICDPACGSGAFLNQALEFLIAEHRYIDELQAKLFGASMILSEVENSILENNLYGVDINEESVEIAKLSLWLRTAQKGRKLTTLNNNIKCGNSLIDDPNVAGEKAFNWQNEFPSIFEAKKKKAWHITTATHNSRYSQRMFDNHVKLGKPVWLSEKEEIIVTESIAEIVEKDQLNVIAYNVCGDHAHILLVCTEEELNKIVQKLKSMSARACNIAMGRTIPMSTPGEHAPRTESAGTGTALEQGTTSEHAPTHVAEAEDGTVEHAPPSRGKTQFHLWAAGADKKEITSDKQFDNTVAYIQNNRIKHKLPASKEIEKIKKEFLCTRQHAYRTEYTGGFDVVIGNPPYLRVQGLRDNFEKETKLYETKYKSATGRFDIYVLFIEKAFSLIKNQEISHLFFRINLWLAILGKESDTFLLKTRL
jgi:REP element-mobilizing transposase RayT